MTFKIPQDIINAVKRGRIHEGDTYNPGNCKHCQNLDLEPYHTQEYWETSRESFERNQNPEDPAEIYGLEE